MTTEYENQPDKLPTNKLLVGSIVGPATTLLLYYLGTQLPVEIINAWIALGAGVGGLIAALVAGWPVRDKLGEPIDPVNNDFDWDV